VSTDYVGFCACGCIAAASCQACGTALCEEHTRTYPEPPAGVSEYATAQFAGAVRLVAGVECALREDQTRNDDEKRADGQLPSNITADEVTQEFLRRIDKEPHERAQVVDGGLIRKPLFVHGWKVHCLRTEYTQQYPDGSSARHPLPVLVTPEGELLAPPAGANQQNLMASTWELVYESEIDLGLYVLGLAGILALSRFEA